MSDQAAEPSSRIGRIIPIDAFTPDDLAKIQAAHEVLQRIGNETADGGAWNEYIDRAHQDLGLILAVRAAAETTADGASAVACNP